MSASDAMELGKSPVDVPKMIFQDAYGDDDDALSTTGSIYSSTQRSGSDSSDEQLAAAESKRVNISRMIMFAIFVLAAAGLGVTTWWYTTGQEQDAFESNFKGLADELIKVSQINANNNFEALEALARAMTSYALGTNGTWPYVTHPNFAAVSEPVLENIQGRFVASVPFVQPEERAQWEAYAVQNQGYIQDLKEYYGTNVSTLDIVPVIFRLGPNESNPVVYDTEPLDPEFNFHVPLWQFVPVIEGFQFPNFQVWQDPVIARTAQTMIRRGESVMSEAFNSFGYEDGETRPWPEAYYMSPIFENFNRDAKIVGLVDTFGDLRLFDNILSAQGLDGLVAVVSNPCAETFSWQINGPESVFIGVGDLAEADFRKYGIVERADALRTNPDCPVSIAIYPSQAFRDEFHTSDPAIFTAATVLIFVVAATFFGLYDFLVEKRQGKVLNTAQRSGAIVDSLFPVGVRERLMDNQETNNNKSQITRHERRRRKLGLHIFDSKPIADYYPEATVLVADIANFSAWSSVREPSQVFSLLETLYNAFDLIAKRRKIFKVESMADCYVACCNVPEPNKNHAVAVARFAQDCRKKMHEVVQKLEVFLGPDTSSLRMRFAINTGPVTAGVLRGEKARFQLFGTTMDLCYRLEGSGDTDEIHVAETTANLIEIAGYGAWLTKRKERVLLKGRGEVQTYWLDYRPQKHSDNSDTAENSSNGSRSLEALDSHTVRLVEWNVDVMGRLLKEIMAMRQVNKSRVGFANVADLRPSYAGMGKSHTVLDEVQEIIDVRTDAAPSQPVDPSSIELPDVVVRQLKNYIGNIAGMYNENPFHNFAHACHVTQAVNKLLSRVVSHTRIDVNTMTYKKDKEADELHNFTFGITSDPLIQFSCALSALIHDADHPGVPNSQLVKEETAQAALYNNKSVAEQNSVDLAWELLMEPQFNELRNCIYTNQEELDRFRQLVVNSVMATDIVDKELGAARKSRWNKAFFTDEEKDITAMQQTQRKATIVIEHLVQAADVSHMMQHWHVYINWNEKFFCECYQAYLDGRAEKDPSEGWYDGEIGFYKFYIIPLAKKLETCGVFGVSSDEFLNYAEANLREWELRGKDMVAKYLENFEQAEGKDLPATA